MFIVLRFKLGEFRNYSTMPKYKKSLNKKACSKPFLPKSYNFVISGLCFNVMLFAHTLQAILRKASIKYVGFSRY